MEENSINLTQADGAVTRTTTPLYVKIYWEGKGGVDEGNRGKRWVDWGKWGLNFACFYPKFRWARFVVKMGNNHVDYSGYDIPSVDTINDKRERDYTCEMRLKRTKRCGRNLVTIWSKLKSGPIWSKMEM